MTLTVEEEIVPLKQDIDGYIKERDKIREQVQSKNEARFSSADIRKRLMARQ